MRTPTVVTPYYKPVDGAHALLLLSPRYLLSIGNVAFSLVLGVIALVLTFVFFPAFTLSLMRGAAGLKEQIVSHSGNPQYEIIARTVLHESSILLMGFTLLARIVLGGMIALGHRLLFGWRD